MKYKKIFLCILLSFILTGCMQVTNNLRIFDDATYQSEMEIYIPADIYNTNKDIKGYINTFISITYDFDYREEETILIDDKEYHSIILKINRQNANDKINITIENGEVLLSHNLAIDEDYLFELDAFGLGDDYKEMLEYQGINITERIQMPGTILSANCGIINGDILTVDVIDSGVSKIIVRSNIENNIGNLFVILIIVIVALVTVIIIYIQINKKKHKRIHEPNINIEKENLVVNKSNDVLDTLALEEKEDNLNLPY